MTRPEVRSSARVDPPAALVAGFADLSRRHADLVDAIAARDSFIAVAAHELRNPMTPMVGQLDLLLAGLRAGRLSSGQVEQRLVRIQRAMNSYLRRTTVLLDVSRLTSGQFRLELAGFDLCVLVREVAESFSDAACHAGSPIEVVVPASLVGTWDHLAMEQIIDNLVSNAVKHGGSQPIEVRVEALDDEVRITVRDRGPGISPDDRTRIFGRFERVAGQTERRSGLGVGLWLVGQLVAAMRGTVSVDDATGGGSALVVSLPRHVCAASA